ncbi:unnamed protein product [Closterium sp. NIES-54]
MSDEGRGGSDGLKDCVEISGRLLCNLSYPTGEGLRQRGDEAAMMRQGREIRMHAVLFSPLQVKDSDRGAAMSDEGRAAVTAIVEQLEAVGLEEPLKSPLVFGGTQTQ